MADLSTFLHHLTRQMAAGSLADLSDRQLVEKALAGRDEAVFRTIVLRHGAMVYRVCQRVLRHDQDAEDALQATFLVLAGRLNSVRKHASLASWLHGVAHRVALRARDRVQTRRRHEREAPAPRDAPPDDVTWGEVREILDAELGRLPEKWRLPLILCYLEGRTQDEAARLLGWGKNTLRNRLGEARDALGRRLTRRGITLSAALSAVLLSDCAAPAALPPGLVSSTAQAAARVPAGGPAGETVSATAVALTEGMVKPMFLTKLNVAAGLLVLGLLAFGAGVALRGPDGSARAGPPEKPPARGNAVGPRPGVDLAKIDRTIRKEPAYVGKPRYALLVLGQKAETRVWLAVDGDTLYVDRNGNGDLTDAGERVAGKHPESPDMLEFRAGPFTEADGKTRHPDIVVYQYFARQFDHQVNGVLVADVLGARWQGTSGEDGGSFAEAAKDAPVIHVNGPLTMRVHDVWVEYDRGTGKKLKEVSEPTGGLIDLRTETGGKDVPYPLRAGERVSTLVVQVGTPGVGRGTFAALGAEGFPADLHPVVEVSVPGKAEPGKRVRAEYVLGERTGSTFYGPVGLPEGAGRDVARLTLSFPAWKEGKVAPAVAEMPMAGPGRE